MREKSQHILIGVLVTLLVSIFILSGVIAMKLWKRRKPKTKKASIRMRSKRPELKLTIPQMKSDGLSHAQYPPIHRPVTTKFIIPSSPSINPQTPATPDTPGFIPTPKYTSPFDLLDKQASLSSLEAQPSKFSAAFSRVRRDRSPESLWKTAVIRTGVAQALLQSPEQRRRLPSTSANGKIKFCIKFDERSRELFVKIVELEDLPLAKQTGLSFPYIKVYLYPGGKILKKSAFEVHILHYPQENTCYFAGQTLEEFKRYSLRIVVLDFDKFSRKEFVAEVYAFISDLDTTGLIISKHLEVEDNDKRRDLGSLLLSMHYQPQSSEVTVIIMKASGLPRENKDGQPTRDYYVKITLLRRGAIVDKRRTKVAKKTVDPVFNEKLVFPVDEYGVKDICLVFDVMSYESRRKHSRVGNVAIGNSLPMRSIMPHELQHFNEMLNHPNKQTAEWHSLIEHDKERKASSDMRDVL